MSTTPPPNETFAEKMARLGATEDDDPTASVTFLSARGMAAIRARVERAKGSDTGGLVASEQGEEQASTHG